MKLVEFENGKFGIRVYWFFNWHFLDLVSSKGYTRSRKDQFFEDCQGTRERAEECMNKKFEKKYMGHKVVSKKLMKSMENLTEGTYKTITFGAGTKFFRKDDITTWENEGNPQKDENGFICTHKLIGTVTIKYKEAKEEEHQKENVVQNPTGKRMIQL